MKADTSDRPHRTRPRTRAARPTRAAANRRAERRTQGERRRGGGARGALQDPLPNLERAHLRLGLGVSRASGGAARGDARPRGGIAGVALGALAAGGERPGARGTDRTRTLPIQGWGDS
eukprot:2991120-Prymnesium_polylepis.1